MRRAYADTPAWQLHYRERGDPGGTPLVLLHPTASSSIQWSARVMPLLPVGIRAIAMDTPGFGMSDPLPGPRPGLGWYASRVCDPLDAGTEACFTEPAGIAACVAGFVADVAARPGPGHDGGRAAR